MSYNSENDDNRWNGLGDDYSPELDSAFIQNPMSSNRERIQREAQLEAQQRMREAQERQLRAQQEQEQLRARQEEQRRLREALQWQEENERKRQAEQTERPVRRERTFDPDQAVSDEEYLESFDDEKQDKKRVKKQLRDIDKKEKGDKKKNKRGKKKHKVLKTILIVLLVLIILFSLAIWNITRKFNHIDTEVSDRAMSMKHQTLNVLLIGQDAREGESGQRSDTMILLSINKTKNVVSMTSIMRDTYVNIPGYGYNRINAAYAYGGIDLLDKTIEENFDITIDGNAMVDFDGFLEAMTAVGSLEMELTSEEAAYMNANPGLGSDTDVSDEVWDLKEGVNELTPSQILCYSRMRYVGNSDWDRTERQRKVISAVFSQVKHGHFIKGYKVANQAAPYITTDVSTFGMIRLALGIMTGGESNSHLIPVEGTYYGDTINGMAVLVPDMDANKKYLKKYINGEE